MLTKYWRKKLQDHRLGIANSAMPSALWLGCHLLDPTNEGLFTSEIPLSGTGYGRVNIFGELTETDLDSGSSINTSIVTFPVAVSDWGDVAYLSISDAETGGNMLESNRLNEVVPIVAGQQLKLVPGLIIARTF